MLALALFLLSRYFLRLREKNYKLEILEIKLKAMQKKINEEKSESSEIIKRLVEQKGPLEKKWEEIQESERIIENKAFQLQQDRDVLEKSKHEIEKLKVKIEATQSKLETVDQHLKQKWSHERQQIEIKKNELIAIIRQINNERTNIFAQQSLIEKEKHSISGEKIKLSKRMKEFEIQKAYFENLRKEALSKKLEMQNAEESLEIEKNRLAEERAACNLAKREIELGLESIKNKDRELRLKEDCLEQLENELCQRTQQNELEKKELVSLLRQILINKLYQIKQAHEKASSKTQYVQCPKMTKKNNDYTAAKELNSDQWKCMVKRCNFQAPGKYAMNMHFKEAHLAFFVKELSYQEVRSKLNGELPAEIYQCHYCKRYFFADQKSNNPIAKIISHVEQCEKSNGHSLVSFRIVNNLREIKNFVIPELPIVCKCILCGQHFKNSNDDELLDHFWQFHYEDLITEAREVSIS